MYERKFKYENLSEINFLCDGKYDIPIIKPESCCCEEFIGFNYAKSTQNKQDKGIHFFVDDYQFVRLWQSPQGYVELLKKFKCIFTPDFSMFSDFPIAMQIYNHYRKHWLGAYYQLQGVKVIPTLCWSNTESFEWCFDGEPSNSTVAVSSVGTQKDKKSKMLFLAGYEKMLEKLKPEKIIFYGNIPDECKGDIIHIKAFQDKFKEAKTNGW